MGIALHPAHGHSHSGAGNGTDTHSPRHSHGSSLTVENEGSVPQTTPCRKQNLNVRAAFIHVVGDFIQSVGVLIAALIIYFKVSIHKHICTIFGSIRSFKK